MNRVILIFFFCLFFLQISSAQQIKIKFIDISFKEQYAAVPFLSISTKPLVSLANNSLKTTLPKREEMHYILLPNKTELFNSKAFCSKDNMPEPLFDLSFLAGFLK